jgi:hypothetical protein
MITNCLFSGNSVGGYRGYGGGMYDGWNATITNCTFSGNRVYGNGYEGYGGGIYGGVIANCIIYGNTASSGGNEIWYEISVNYSDVNGGQPGTGNINADPCFVKCGYWGDANDPNIHRQPNDTNAIWIDGNYRLLSGSPCIDAGDNNSVRTPLDLDGFPRIIAGGCNGSKIVDMGAYEFLRADINHDGAVNFVDFALFALHWWETNCGQCGGADLTCDGNVNFADLREFAKWWLAGGSN